MTEAFTVAPGLYARKGKRVTSYSTQIDGKRVPLGTDLDSAKRELNRLLDLPQEITSIEVMCKAYLAEQWKLLRAKDSSALAEGTIVDYEMCLTRRVIPVFGAMNPADFRPTHAAQYLKMRRVGVRDTEGKLQQSAVRGNREMAALASAFNFGMAEGIVESNPCRGVRRNRERPRHRKVAVAELNAFLKHAADKGGSAYLVALIGACVALSGRRRAEMLSLKKSALTDAGISMKDAKTKGNEADRFYLVKWSPTLRSVIEEVGKIKRNVSSIYLFPKLDGGVYADRGFKTLWNRLMHSYCPGGAASPDWFRAHDLRALYVSEMLEQDRDPNTHANEETMRKVYDRRKVINVSPLA